MYKAAFQNSPIGMAILNIRGNIIESNKALQEFLGYTELELNNLSYQDLTFPPDLAIDNLEFSKLVNGLILDYSIEKRYRHKNGGIIWGKLYVTTIKSKEGNPYLLGIVQDINKEKEQHLKIASLHEDLKLKNQKIKALHCIAEFGYYEIDLVNKTYQASFEFYQLLGIEYETTLQEIEQIKNLIHPEDLSSIKQLFKDSFENKNPFNHEFRCIHNLTGEVIFVISYAIIEFNENNPVRIFGIIHNISKIRVLNEQLKNANKKLEDFAYLVSHDLKEPIRGVVGMLGLLEKKAIERLNEDEKEYVELAVNSARRMNRMIEGLLEYSRTGNINESYQIIGFFELVQDAIKALREPIEYSNAKINIPDIDISIKGYPNLLSRLIQNLLSNSIKYSGNRTPEISIWVIDTENYYEINVQDNGIGIAIQDQEKIFKMFNRVNHSNDSNSNGIGLAICKHIASLHQGSIIVKSNLDQGSTFIVRLSKNI